MRIVFIRHAKTENYDTNKRQGPDSKLGITGKKQATLLGNRLKKVMNQANYKYDSILTSHWVRATETAKILSKKTGLQVFEHPIIHEYLSNSILTNQPLDSDIVKEYKLAVKNKGVNFEWKFRGEGECMRDVIKRAQAFKDELITIHKDKNYLVVSHGLFITSFVTLLILGDNYDDAAFKQVSELIRLENTSLTSLEYFEAENSWRIINLNDHGHLVK